MIKTAVLLKMSTFDRLEVDNGEDGDGISSVELLKSQEN